MIDHSRRRYVLHAQIAVHYYKLFPQCHDTYALYYIRFVKLINYPESDQLRNRFRHTINYAAVVSCSERLISVPLLANRSWFIGSVLSTERTRLLSFSEIKEYASQGCIVLFNDVSLCLVVPQDEPFKWYFSFWRELSRWFVFSMMWWVSIPNAQQAAEWSRWRIYEKVIAVITFEYPIILRSNLNIWGGRHHMMTYCKSRAVNRLLRLSKNIEARNDVDCWTTFRNLTGLPLESCTILFLRARLIWLNWETRK